MKGTIFKHLEAYIVEVGGYESLELILEQVELESTRPFVGPLFYPDSDLLSIFGAACQHFSLEPGATLQSFGEFLFHRLAADSPHFLRGVDTVVEMLHQVDGVIHVEVKKLSPESYLPRLRCETLGEGKVLMTYQSDRKLCQLFVGLARGAAQHFRQTMRETELACMHRQDEECRFEFEFHSIETHAA